LLTQQITIRVDGGTAKRYPFSFCTTVGCFAQIGFTTSDVAAFRAGNAATVTISPAGAASGTTVDLTASLKGFTAGYKAVQDATNAAAAARAAQ
jgi:invasion protein IalB